MAKQRIDVLLVEQGFFPSREKARAAIMAGQILADRQRVDKAGTKVDTGVDIEIKGDVMPYVSRGGLKLEKAMQAFGFDLNGAVAMDIGASTGGFTDCMLQKGASKVFAVDVGYGQLDWKLRNDPRVVVMERTNIRHVKAEDIGETMDFISIDVSFISLKLVLPVAKALLGPQGKVVALIKPQFEAGRQQVGKNGVVRDAAIHAQVVEKVVDFAQELGFFPEGLSFSPIRGPKGNVEFLVSLSLIQLPQIVVTGELIDKVVQNAHGNQW